MGHDEASLLTCKGIMAQIRYEDRVRQRGRKKRQRPRMVGMSQYSQAKARGQR